MFLGASTGRAGSKWITQVFNRIGFPCSHEVFFNARSTVEWPQTKGEWSAQCVPALSDYDVPVFHQVRHPLEVVGSYLNRGWFADIELGPENRFMVDHAGVDRDGHPLRELARFYVGWNRRIQEHADMWWRVEDFDDQTATLVSWRLKLPMRHGAAWSKIRPSNRSSHRKVEWGDIPEPERSQLRQMAEEYGY